MAATTKDLARICGVSRTTVTRALYNQGRISEETRQRVLDAARELGYHPDLLARSLVKGRSMTIGIVLCDLKNMFFSYVIDAMEPAAREKGYVLNITLHDNDAALEKEIIDHLSGYKIDGMIIQPAVCTEKEEEFLRGLDFPVLVVGGAPLGALPFVGNDEREAARRAAEEIIRRGYDRMYFVFPDFADPKKEFAGHRRRYDGFMEAVHAAGLRGNVLGTENYACEAVRAVLEAKSRGERAAFLCSGDVYAAKIMMKAYEERLTAGRDYGVMGFDNDELMQILPVKLWTVENHKEEIGRHAIEGLIRAVETGDAGRADRRVPFEIIEGDSL